MRVALVQMCSTDDLEANLESAEAYIRESADRGAEFVALPENFAYLRREGQAGSCPQDLDGEVPSLLLRLASELGIWILGGSFHERIEGDERVYNTSLLVSPEGEIAAHYRKIHLFDIDLGAEGGSFCESATIAPGSEIVVAETPFGKLGMSICYDLRFPELYREFSKRGAHWIAIPSAFLRETGHDHWLPLLQARAIENQAFVLAPAQCGQHSPKRSSNGHSMILDPWGRILAEAEDEPEIILADCDLEELERIRNVLPALRNRRL